MTETLFYISPWVLGSVCVGLGIGWFLGRTNRVLKSKSGLDKDHEATMQVLIEVLAEMERITGDVHERNSEIQQTAQDVDCLEVSAEMFEIKQAVLGHVSRLLHSNEQLENDLLYAQYRMQEQTHEIDSVRREARTDALTGVANRKAFDEKLHIFLGNWQREGTGFVLIIVDLDHFKRINDSHGHQAGDLVLELVGENMKELLRSGDFVARLGGDEFGILLPHTDMEVGREVAERIRERVSEEASHTTKQGGLVAVALSVGVAAVREGDTVETIYARADDALYKSKRLGRNQVSLEEAVAAS